MSEKFYFSLMPLGIGSAFFYVIVKADENIAWPFPDAESLAAELNAREEKLAALTAERDRLRAAVEGIKQKAGAEMDYGSQNDTVRFCYVTATTALSAKGEINE